ncbi:hypothetical protein ACHAWO_002509 [Cyclotella atomus]|uniref:Uncharacterized protein n=1 Tax=Cyclotella atomus TaxID=382360 RepID=A0ABD3NCX9_9STRA
MSADISSTSSAISEISASSNPEPDAELYPSSTAPSIGFESDAKYPHSATDAMKPQLRIGLVVRCLKSPSGPSCVRIKTSLSEQKTHQSSIQQILRPNVLPQYYQVVPQPQQHPLFSPKT